MRRTLNQLCAAVLLVGGLSLAGCKQNEGERCEVTSDCSSGLTCEAAGTANGFCITGPAGTLPLPDAATGDVGAAVDQATSSDVSGDATPDTHSEVPASDAKD